MKTALSLHLRVQNRGTDKHVISSPPQEVMMLPDTGRCNENWKQDPGPLRVAWNVGLGAQRKELECQLCGLFF